MSVLKDENRSEVEHCSICVGSYAEEADGIPVAVDSELYVELFEALESVQYRKTLHTILGNRVANFSVGDEMFYRILLLHKDKSRTEIVVIGSELLIGSASKSGLVAYKIIEGAALVDKLNSIF